MTGDQKGRSFTLPVCNTIVDSIVCEYILLPNEEDIGGTRIVGNYKEVEIDS